MVGGGRRGHLHAGLGGGVATGTLELLWAGAAGVHLAGPGLLGEGSGPPAIGPRSASGLQVTPQEPGLGWVPLGMFVSSWSGLIWLPGGDPLKNWGVLTRSQQQTTGRSW